MMRTHRGLVVCFLGLLAGLAVLAGIAFLAGRPKQAEAQTVSSPITRHVVLYWAKRYTTYTWYWNGRQYTSIPYAWGYADWIDPALGSGTADCNYFASLFQTRLNNNCYTGCDTQAGDDCSGYVMRVWGRPVGEAKWSTVHIAERSVVVPCRTTDPQCLQQAVRNEDLPRRMRMGDVFDDWYGQGRHVVLLYYFHPVTLEPRFYEENRGPCNARLNEGGWAWLEANGGWWNGTDGYRPYRYRYNADAADTRYILDDIYLPDLRNAWYNWFSYLYVRNNNTTSSFHVVQHTTYLNAGGDANAYDNKTLARTAGNDLWEVSTSSLAPTNYSGGGVVAADTGTGAVVYIQGNGQTMAYTGIYPFSGLGMRAASTLYMPVFFYSAGGFNSKIFVQNAGKVSTDITATYYGDDGRTCTHTVGNVAPWGMRILEVNACNWGGSPPAGGSVRLSASQPIAAITEQWTTAGGGERRSAYNAFSQGASLLYAPILLRNFYGWNTTLHVQNLSGSAASVSVTYYSQSGVPICSDSLSIPAYQHRAIDQGGSTTCLSQYSGYHIFSGRIQANQQVTAVVNQDLPGEQDFQAYNAFIAGRKELVLPFVRNESAFSWYADIVIQNTTSYATQATVKFYNFDGGLVGTVSCELAAYGSCELYGQIPSYRGSAVIQAGQNVAVVTNLLNNTQADGAMSYSALELKTSSILGGPEEEVLDTSP